jgi:hypothetical protein
MNRCTNSFPVSTRRRAVFAITAVSQLVLVFVGPEAAALTPVTPHNPNLVTGFFEGVVRDNYPGAGDPMRAFLYYDKTVANTGTIPQCCNLYEFTSGTNMGMGVVSRNTQDKPKVEVFRAPPGTAMNISTQHDGGDTAYAVRAYAIAGERAFTGIALDLTSFPSGSLPPSVPASSEFSNIRIPAPDFTDLQRASIATTRALSVEDIFKDAITAVADGPYIAAGFAPFGGAMSLKDAALLLGVDHFNWLQTVSGPGNVEIQVRDIPNIGQLGDPPYSTAPGTLVSSTRPTIDPVQLGSGNEALVFRVDGSELKDLSYVPVETPPYVDSLPYYLDEFNVASNGHVSKYTTDFDLLFEDRPRVPDWVLSGTNGVAAPNYFLSFTTTVVGVDSDGEVVHFNVPGASFRWKSNTAYLIDPEDTTGGAGRIVYLRTLSTDYAPDISSGGVFDVELIGVPEPSFVTLVMIALFSALSCVRQRQCGG